MSWEQFLLSFVAAIIGGGAAGAGITAYVQHRRHEKEKTDAVTYLAHVLAFEFEGYAIACAEKLSDAEPDHHEMQEPGNVGSLPDAPMLPQSPAYQWLSHDLRERAFAFPQDIAATRRSLAYIWQVADVDDYDQQAIRELSTFGLNAAALAADLRAAHQVAPRRLGTQHWDIVDYLRKKQGRRA